MRGLEPWHGRCQLQFHVDQHGRTRHQGGCSAPFKLMRAEIGGDVVWFDGADPDQLASDVSEKTDSPARVVDGRVRVESDRGHEVLREVIEALPGRVRSATLAQPSLEDVFFAKTGHLLQEEGSEA